MVGRAGREMKTKKKGLGCRAGWPSPEEAPAEDAGNLIDIRKGGFVSGQRLHLGERWPTDFLVNR